MALIPCPECRAEVSSKAIQCPKCGHPIAKAVSARPAGVAASRSGGLGAVVLLVLPIVIGGVLFATNPDEPRIRAQLSSDIPGFGLGAGIGELIGTAKYKYNNYGVFSTMTIVGLDGKERTIARGFLGRVSVVPPDDWK